LIEPVGPWFAYLRASDKEVRMRGTSTALAVGMVVAAFAVAGCGGSSNGTATETSTTTSTETTQATGTTLKGNVGPGFDISLTTADGKAVTTLPAGSYTIVVDDQADIHNFHLTGPGVDSMTDVSGTGTVTWNVDLKAGSYHFQCDPHAGTMNGDFTVTG
jgi:plastocyanin